MLYVYNILSPLRLKEWFNSLLPPRTNLLGTYQKTFFLLQIVYPSDFIHNNCLTVIALYIKSSSKSHSLPQIGKINK